jgi:O-antigen ligase
MASERMGRWGNRQMGGNTRIQAAMNSFAEMLGWPNTRRIWSVLVVVGVLLASFFFGLRASPRWLLLIVAGAAGIVLVSNLRLGLFGLVMATLIVPFEIGTGTEVSLNAATLLTPALFGLWFVDSLRRQKLSWVTSRVDRPFILFLLAGLLSLLLGNALWDPAVPKSSNFWLVQLAQWFIFVLAALALWLMANLIHDQVGLQRLVQFYLIVAGVLAILYVIPGIGVRVKPFTTGALGRSSFWMLLSAVAGGQLVFNRRLSSRWRFFLVCILVAVLVYAFYWDRNTVSTYGSIVIIGGMLAWLRWPHLRWVAILLFVIALVSGLLFSFVYEFAGGDAEWESSGGSRLTLIGRVIEVTMRNPITGLGPASYRPYAGARPLKYGYALWISPKINSHNNYVDLFAQTGLLGLGLFLWIAVELGLLGWRLRLRYREDFIGGYVNGMFAAWICSLVLMALADWILPFVYNIGFRGFQASILIWMFLGGLVAVEHWESQSVASQSQ